MNDLTVELVILDDKANLKIGSFEKRLETTTKKINDTGKSGNFARAVSVDLETAEKRAADFNNRINQVITTGGLLAGVFAGAGAAFGKEALDAARAAANGQRILQAAAKETGISFQNLKQQAKEFGDQTLQSNAQASASFAQIVNFAQAAGRADKLEEFRKRFADLAAAKGINASQLGDISRQLNALTDEATDKLLNANPSAFYDKFAQSLGKTAEKLTDAEKRAAIFDEVLKRGIIFDGEANKKLNDAASAVDRLSKKFDDAKESIGRAIIPLTEFLEKTVQLATADPKLYQNDRAGNEPFFQAQRAKLTADALRASDQKIRDAQKNPFGSLQNYALSKINLATGFFDEKARNAAIEQATKEATEYIADLDKRIKGALASGNQGLIGLAQNEFRKNINLFDLDTREKFLKDFGGNSDSQLAKKLAEEKKKQDELNKSIKEGREKVEELEKGYLSLLDSVFARTNSNNPFVSLFSEADRQAKVFKETTKGLSADLISQLSAMEAKTQNLKLFETRVDTALSAFDLRDQAAGFRNAGNRQFFDDSVGGSIRRGGFFPGLGGTYGSHLANEAGGADKLTDAQRRDIYEVEQLKNLGYEDTPFNRLNNSSLISRLASERVAAEGGENLSLNERLEKQLSIINGFASTDEEKASANRRFIALTQGVEPGKLSDRLREQAAFARESEAGRLEKSETEAVKQRERQIEATEGVRTEVAELNKIAREQGFKAVMEIVDRSNGAVNIKGASPTPADTAKTYGEYQSALR